MPGVGKKSGLALSRESNKPLTFFLSSLREPSTFVVVHRDSLDVDRCRSTEISILTRFDRSTKESALHVTPLILSTRAAKGKQEFLDRFLVLK